MKEEIEASDLIEKVRREKRVPGGSSQSVSRQQQQQSKLGVPAGGSIVGSLICCTG